MTTPQQVVNATLLVFFGFELTTGCLAQSVGAKSLPRDASELTHNQVCQQVTAIFRASGHPDIELSQLTCRLRVKPIAGVSRRVWEVRRGDGVVMAFHSQSGQLLSYTDLQRTVDRGRKRGRSQSLVASDENAAKLFVRNTLTEFGIPSTWTLTDFEFYKEGEGRNDKCSYFGSKFKNHEGVIVGSIAIDGQDGRVLSFARKP